MQQRKFDVLIIGGGPGGYTAALYCARAGLNALVLEQMTPGGQMTTTHLIDNYPGFNDGVGGFELGEKMKAGAERFGVKTEFAQVTALRLTETPKKVETTGGAYEADAVILAMGTTPRELGLPEEKALLGRGISYCATCDGMFFKDKTVLVVGGGDTAAADALVLAKLCKKVYLVHRRDSLRAAASYLAPLKNAGNISFVWNAQVTKLLYETVLTGAAITDKITGKITEIPCEGIFVAIGRNPNTALVKEQVLLDENGYICADETTKTNIPGVFAVGDLRTKPLRQIVTAAADGAVASMFVEEYLSLHR